MSHFSDELISAYLDDQLDSSERKQVEERLAEDPQLRQFVRDYDQIRYAIANIPPPTPSKGFADRVVRGIQTSASSSTAASPTNSDRHTSGFGPLMLWTAGSLAAALLVCLLGYQADLHRRDTEIAKSTTPAPNTSALNTSAPNLPSQDLPSQAEAYFMYRNQPEPNQAEPSGSYAESTRQLKSKRLYNVPFRDSETRQLLRENRPQALQRSREDSLKIEPHTADAQPKFDVIIRLTSRDQLDLLRADETYWGTLEFRRSPEVAARTESDRMTMSMTRAQLARVLEQLNLADDRVQMNFEHTQLGRSAVDSDELEDSIQSSGKLHEALEAKRQQRKLRVLFVFSKQE